MIDWAAVPTPLPQAAKPARTYREVDNIVYAFNNAEQAVENESEPESKGHNIDEIYATVEVHEVHELHELFIVLNFGYSS